MPTPQRTVSWSAAPFRSNEGFSGAPLNRTYRFLSIHHPIVNLTAPLRSEREVLDPALLKWVDLVTLSVAESQDASWAECVHLQPSRTPQAPLLHGATLRVATVQASRIVRRLAGELGILDVERVDPLSVLLVGVERDAETLDILAGRLAIPADTVAVLAQLVALPLLLNASRKLDADASRTWQRGYCPVCGAFPAMIEMRGIQRERRMRCGCCGSDWTLPVLRCAFCDEIDHQRLGFLLNDGGDQHIRLETCSTCRGYLKSLTTLGALPFTTLVTKDSATIAYDLAARDRGFSRPSRPGWQLQVEIVQ